MQNAERLVKQKIDSSDADNEYNFESELELLDDGTELVNAVKYVVDNNEDAKSPTSESAASNVSSEKKGLCDSESSSKLFSEGLAKRADVVRTKVRQRIESIMQNYEHYTEVEPEIREKLIKLYYLDATLETVLSKYNLLKRKIYPSSFGVYYPSSPKDEARKTDKSLGSSDVEKPASESTESVESSAETAAAEGTVLRTLSPPAVQDYVEPAAASPSASEQYKQREREEGDFHKLGVFIRHTKSSQSLTHPLDASGSQLRQLLLDESGVTRSEDIESFINRLRGMSDAELQAYFRCIYGKKLAAPDYDDSDDNSDSSESFGEAHKLGQVIAPDAMVVQANVPAVTITEN